MHVSQSTKGPVAEGLGHARSGSAATGPLSPKPGRRLFFGELRGFRNAPCATPEHDPATSRSEKLLPSSPPAGQVRPAAPEQEASTRRRSRPSGAGALCGSALGGTTATPATSDARPVRARWFRPRRLSPRSRPPGTIRWDQRRQPLSRSTELPPGIPDAWCAELLSGRAGWRADSAGPLQVSRAAAWRRAPSGRSRAALPPDHDRPRRRSSLPRW